MTRPLPAVPLLLAATSNAWAQAAGNQTFAPANATAQLSAPDVSNMTDILDIKPVRDIGFDPDKLLWLLAGVALAALVALAIWLWRRRKLGPSAPPPPPPHELARSALAELRAQPELPAKAFYFRLSAVVRGYIEGSFRLKALEMTTEELLPRVRQLALSAPLEAELKRFLRAADPVKYAGLPAQEDRMRRDLDFAETLVAQTTPSEAEEADTTPAQQPPAADKTDA